MPAGLRKTELMAGHVCAKVVCTIRAVFVIMHCVHPAIVGRGRAVELQVCIAAIAHVCVAMQLGSTIAAENAAANRITVARLIIMPLWPSCTSTAQCDLQGLETSTSLPDRISSLALHPKQGMEKCPDIHIPRTRR
jgi:hypothetical protein